MHTTMYVTYTYGADNPSQPPFTSVRLVMRIDKSHPNYAYGTVQTSATPTCTDLKRVHALFLVIFMCDLHLHLGMKFHRRRQAVHEVALTGGFEIALK